MAQLPQLLFFLAFHAHTGVVVVGEPDDFLQLADDLFLLRNQLLLFQQKLLALLKLSTHTLSLAIFYPKSDISELVFLSITVPH